MAVFYSQLSRIRNENLSLVNAEPNNTIIGKTFARPGGNITILI